VRGRPALGQMDRVATERMARSGLGRASAPMKAQEGTSAQRRSGKAVAMVCDGA
jgi:hypothetical protein